MITVGLLHPKLNAGLCSDAIEDHYTYLPRTAGLPPNSLSAIAQRTPINKPVIGRDTSVRYEGHGACLLYGEHGFWTWEQYAQGTRRSVGCLLTERAQAIGNIRMFCE